MINPQATSLGFALKVAPKRRLTGTSGLPWALIGSTRPVAEGRDASTSTPLRIGMAKVGSTGRRQAQSIAVVISRRAGWGEAALL